MSPPTWMLIMATLHYPPEAASREDDSRVRRSNAHGPSLLLGERDEQAGHEREPEGPAEREQVSPALDLAEHEHLHRRQ